MGAMASVATRKPPKENIYTEPTDMVLRAEEETPHSIRLYFFERMRVAVSQQRRINFIMLTMLAVICVISIASLCVSVSRTRSESPFPNALQLAQGQDDVNDDRLGKPASSGLSKADVRAEVRSFLAEWASEHHINVSRSAQERHDAIHAQVGQLDKKLDNVKSDQVLLESRFNATLNTASERLKITGTTCFIVVVVVCIQTLQFSFN